MTGHHLNVIAPRCHASTPLDGSIKDRCAMCQTPLWINLHIQNLAKTHPVRTYCLPCVNSNFDLLRTVLLPPQAEP